MKKRAKLLAAALTLVMACGFSACKQEGTAVHVEKPSWETQSAAAAPFSFELPKDWSKIEDPTGNQLHIYVPAGYDPETGASNINIAIQQTGEKAVGLAAMKVAFPKELEAQLKQAFPDVGNFSYSDMKTPNFDFLIAQYDYTVAGIHVEQTQYYPVVDNYTVVITATKMAVDSTPPVLDVAKHMAGTLQKTE